MPPTEFVLATGVAAFSCGPDRKISIWNAAAGQMFARCARDVVGRRCHEVLSGRDVFGNEFCSRVCPCRRMAYSGNLIQPFHMEVQDGLGHRFMARVTILVVHEDGGGPELVHLLEALVPNDSASLADDGDEDMQRLSKIGPEFLTHRELEVLQCLALGLGTDEIAQRLQISAATVRNHVAHCLLKLDVHSRLEAVAVAHRLQLV